MTTATATAADTDTAEPAVPQLGHPDRPDLMLRRGIAQEIRETADDREYTGGVGDFLWRHGLDPAGYSIEIVRTVLRAVAQDLELRGLPAEPADRTAWRSVDGNHLWIRLDQPTNARDAATTRDGTFPFAHRHWYCTSGHGPLSWLCVHGMGLRAVSIPAGLRPDLNRPVVDLDRASEPLHRAQGDAEKLRARIGGALSLHKEAPGVGEETTRCGTCREPYPCRTRNLLDYAAFDAAVAEALAADTAAAPATEVGQLP